MDIMGSGAILGRVIKLPDGAHAIGAYILFQMEEECNTHDIPTTPPGP